MIGSASPLSEAGKEESSRGTFASRTQAQKESGRMAFLYSAGKALVVLGGTGYVAMLGLLVAFQRRLIWMKPRPVQTPGFGDVKIIRCSEGPKTLAMLHVPPQHQSLPTLVHFHGNSDQIGWGPAWMARAFSQHCGFGFLGMEYPSYGLSEGGRVSETAAYAAAQNALRYLMAEDGLKTPKEQIILFGESIGCAVALEMAKDNLGAKVVLIAPFYNLRDLILDILPWYLVWPLRFFPVLVFDKLENHKKLPQVKLPVCIIHGDQDEIVPFSQGQKLAALKPEAKFFCITGGHHNDLFEETFDDVFQKITSFVREES